MKSSKSICNIVALMERYFIERLRVLQGHAPTAILVRADAGPIGRRGSGAAITSCCCFAAHAGLRLSKCTTDHCGARARAQNPDPEQAERRHQGHVDAPISRLDPLEIGPLLGGKWANRQRSVLATRNPTSLLRLSADCRKRLADRPQAAVFSQLPPRMTWRVQGSPLRAEPSVGAPL
jgi:hypothetical protein